jgi:peptidoglycan-associated lipoprotein
MYICCLKEGEGSMNKFMRIGVLSALACALLLGMGCASKRSTSGDVPGDGDYAGQRLTAEEARIADEISNARVYFEYDKYELRADSKQVLGRKAELLKRYPKIRVSIQGHCDERGTEEYNLALGERRARAAYEFLTLSGVGANQLEMVSYGKLQPVVQGRGEAAWAQNRRDEFIVLNPR